MNVLFVWNGLTGYMGDCWRSLSKKNGINLKITIDLGNNYFGSGFKASEVMKELDWSDNLPIEYQPDIVFSVGWYEKLCREAGVRDWGNNVKKVCCFDMPWEWRIRKIVARPLLWSYLRNYDAAFVPGISSEKYARWLGFKYIFTGEYGTDVARFGKHIGGGGFLYVGRNAPEKGLDVLDAAYKTYKKRGGVWPLKIVTNASPAMLADFYSVADCFVLASKFEPWGVVLVEAAAAGLPIICTDKCGARREVVKGNGLVVKANSPKALAEAMLNVERGEAGIDGDIGRNFAKPYGCEAWADRVVEICRELSDR